MNSFAINTVGEKYPRGSKIDAMTCNTSRLVVICFSLAPDVAGTANVSFSQLHKVPKALQTAPEALSFSATNW